MKSSIGFRPRNAVLYRAYNVVVASMIFTLALPVFLLVCVLLFVTQGPSIFYRGERIGKGERTFHILKFRTLCPERAAQVTADKTLPANSNIETPLGGLLRDTRLDELPQLINIILGDMNISGPRPVRPAIARIERQRINGYETRFEVRPGLIGPAQALFGHSASKRLRARVNNAAVRRPVSIPAEIALLARIGLSIFERIVSKLMKGIFALLRREKVLSRRDIRLVDARTGSEMLVDRIGITDLSVRRRPLSDQQILEIRLQSGGIRRAHIELSKTDASGIYAYEAMDDVSAFVIERYALARVVVPPMVALFASEETAIHDLSTATSSAR